MSKSAIEAICEAEKIASEKHSKLLSDQRDNLSKAEKDSSRDISMAKTNAVKYCAEERAKAEKEAEAFLVENKEKAALEANKLIEEKKVNIDKAVETIIGGIS